MIESLSFNPVIPPIQPRTAADEGEHIQQNKTRSDLHAQNDKSSTQQGDQRKKLEEIINGLNAFLQPKHTSLKFQLHEKLNQYYCQVIDDKTKEVVREIPPKKLLDAYALMAEQLGFIIDKKI